MTHKLFWSTAVSAVAIIVSASCYDPHAQSSKIVRELQANGSGNLSTYTPQGLAAWFSQRPELAKHIALECVPLALKGDAHWIETSEGNACRVAAMVQPPPVVLANQKAW